MKIAFWSSAKGNTGVTSNLACVSVVSAMEYSYKSILIENHFQKNKLENVLMYNRANYHLRENDNYQLKPIGMDYIMYKLSNVKYTNMFVNNSTKVVDYSEPIHISDNINVNKTNEKADQTRYIHSQAQLETKKVINEASLEILGNSLYYIPNNEQTNKEAFDYNLYDNINHILKALESFADITYIDTSNHNSLSSKIILEEVDLVVVNLVQNSAMIEHFFRNYSSILSKCVFLIGSYHKKSDLDINKISKAHLINKSNIAAIPYNVEYQEAVLQGTVVEFFARNYSCKRKNPNYNFIHEVKKAVNMIIGNAELICRKEK
ncbi:MAG: putative rane protein [Anaerocolumna sp.]|jgi:hypothetical protein|nr:putative rane protein [Anaerocolumna sp.]